MAYSVSSSSRSARGSRGLLVSSKGSTARETNALAAIKTLGLVHASKEDIRTPRPPFEPTFASGQDIFTVPEQFFDRTLDAARSWLRDTVPDIADAAIDGFECVPQEIDNQRLSAIQRSVLYTAVYAIRIFDTFKNGGSDEKPINDALVLILGVFLKVGGSIIKVTRTDVPASRHLIETFGHIFGKTVLTAVKPDGSVGFDPFVVDFKQGDPDIVDKDIQTYLARLNDGQVKVFYNFALISKQALFPYFIVECKGPQARESQVELQAINGMFLAIRTWQDLAAQAKAADPVTFGGGGDEFNHLSSVDYNRVYGLTSYDQNWKIWMVKQDPNFPDRGYPIVMVGSGVWRERADVKRLFYLLDRIMSEARARLDFIGRCLYSLRGKLAPLKVGDKRHRDVDDSDQVGVAQRVRIKMEADVENDDGGDGDDDEGDGDGDGDGDRDNTVGGPRPRDHAKRGRGDGGGKGRHFSGAGSSSKRKTTDSTPNQRQQSSTLALADDHHMYDHQGSVLAWRKGLSEPVGATAA